MRDSCPATSCELGPALSPLPRAAAALCFWACLLAHQVVPAPATGQGPDAGEEEEGDQGPCEGEVQFTSLTGEISAYGGPPPDGAADAERVCMWHIIPPVHVVSITFITHFAAFEGDDQLIIFGDHSEVVGVFSALRPLATTMVLQGSRSAFLVFRSSSHSSGFRLSYRCSESDSISVLSHRLTPAEFVLLAALVFIPFCVFCVMMNFICVAMWRNRIDYMRVLQASSVVAHAEHLRRRGMSPDEERRVTGALQALPVQTAREHMSSATADDCCLCLDSYGADDLVRVLPCRHYFHKECVDKWFESRRFRARTCPLCKQNPVSLLDQVAQAGPAPGGSSPSPDGGPLGNASSSNSGDAANLEAGSIADAVSEMDDGTMLHSAPRHPYSTATFSGMAARGAVNYGRSVEPTAQPVSLARLPLQPPALSASRQSASLDGRGAPGVILAAPEPPSMSSAKPAEGDRAPPEAPQDEPDAASLGLESFLTESA